MKERRLKAGHFFLDAETGMGAGEVPLVLFKLHVRCMLFSLDSQAIHLYCNAYFGSRYTRYRQHKLSHRLRGNSTILAYCVQGLRRKLLRKLLEEPAARGYHP